MPSGKKGDGYLGKLPWWEGGRAPGAPQAGDRVLWTQSCISCQAFPSFFLPGPTDPGVGERVAWGHPDVRERVALRTTHPSQNQFCVATGASAGTLQGQGTFANTTLNVNQLFLPWYL